MPKDLREIPEIFACSLQEFENRNGISQMPMAEMNCSGGERSKKEEEKKILIPLSLHIESM